MNDKIRRGSLLAAAASTQGGGFDIDNYLTIVALEDGLTASLSVNDVEYCIDGSDNWTTLTAGTASPAINKGQTLSFRGNLTPASYKGVGTFTISKSCDLTGNCMSLLFGNNAKSNKSLSGKDYAFYKLFYNCRTIKNVSSNFLPATTLANYCYNYMFYMCTSLTTAPELPAKTLKDNCYAYMFGVCTSLTTAPKLPATTLAEYCYEYMFDDCTSLTTAPALPATTLVSGCYRSMFAGTNVLPDCSNINFSSSTVVASGGLQGLFAGTKVTDSDLRSILPINSNGKYYLPCTTLARDCYQKMFWNCKSLTTAPELPATTLANYCYYYMFHSCTSLITAPALPATTLANGCYQNMLYNCTSLTTAPKLPATTLAQDCYKNMFYGCSSLITAPQLPATTLKDSCYAGMFRGCSKLNYIKAMFTTTPSSSYTSNWVYGVASSGTFVKNKNATWNVTGTYGIPSKWTVQTA